MKQTAGKKQTVDQDAKKLAQRLNEKHVFGYGVPNEVAEELIRGPVRKQRKWNPIMKLLTITAIVLPVLFGVCGLVLTVIGSDPELLIGEWHYEKTDMYVLTLNADGTGSSSFFTGKSFDFRWTAAKGWLRLSYPDTDPPGEKLYKYTVSKEKLVLKDPDRIDSEYGYESTFYKTDAEGGG